jgi:hypothetical protein
MCGPIAYLVSSCISTILTALLYITATHSRQQRQEAWEQAQEEKKAERFAMQQREAVQEAAVRKAEADSKATAAAHREQQAQQRARQHAVASHTSAHTTGQPLLGDAADGEGADGAVDRPIPDWVLHDTPVSVPRRFLMERYPCKGEQCTFFGDETTSGYCSVCWKREARCAYSTAIYIRGCH